MIPTSNNPDGRFTVTNIGKAESLNSFFSCICVDRDLANMPEITNIITGDSKLNNLDVGKSQNWHTYTLKE